MSQNACINDAPLLAAMQRHWGYDAFRPLQQSAMHGVLRGQDSLVVLPTGGGKSLCYQVPAVCLEGTAVVVSPLISLMKDQVDALRANGVSAAFINSTLTHREKWEIADDLQARRLKLLYVAPETLCTAPLLKRLREAQVSFFAIDEAHCVSHWGHDFRPHYRQLAILREQFPDVGIHAFTATATERVRDDVIEQLRLRNPSVHVGRFDRPNLVYRVERRKRLLQQICPILDRHRDRAGIIYCISRKETESLSAELNANGYQSRPYHAGMTDEARRTHQEAFIKDEVQTIVATVAFGMGIDKPDVRYVIHAGIPKSVEHYQQETGRAGRDGLEAECWLFVSGKDQMTWERLLAEQSEEVRQASLRMLQAMLDYADGAQCRHRLLVRHFGQDLDVDCGDGCDVCRGEVAFLDGALRIGQMILSSVYRQGERFGSEYTAFVLTGKADERVERHQHQQLSTFGLLKDHPVKQVQDWIGDLTRQGYLQRVGEYQTLKITESGRRLLKGDATPNLRAATAVPKPTERRRREDSPDSWEGVDRGLFEGLRSLRLELARERGVPPYIIFGDAALRDMARRRPTTTEGFRAVRGVGEKKSAEFGPAFTAAIAAYCGEHAVPTDIAPPAAVRPLAPERVIVSGSEATRRACALFASGASITQVAQELDRAHSTTVGYLIDYLKSRLVVDPSPWVDAATAARVVAASVALDAPDRLKPIFEHLQGAIDYDTLKIVLICRRNAAMAAQPDKTTT